MTLLATLFFWPRTVSAFCASAGSERERTNAGSTSTVNADSDVRKLDLGKPVEREFAGGQRHSYQVTLASGQFLHAVVEPRGVGVTVRLFGPNGEAIMSLNVTAGSSEPMFLIAKEQGIYRIEIRSPESAAVSSYRLRVEELRVAGSQDSNRALAESALAEGEQLPQEGMAEDSNRALAESALDEGEQLPQEGMGESTRKKLEKYEQALRLWRAAGDRRGEAETLYQMGSVYHDLGENQKALDYYNQALPLLRAAEEHAKEGATLNRIGLVYHDLGEHQRALDYFRQALALRSTAGDLGGEGQTLNNIGMVYHSLALPRIGDLVDESSTLILIPSALEKEALDYYNRALPLRRMAGDLAGESKTLSNIGLLYQSQGENQKALDYLKQAVALQRGRAREGVTLNRIGWIYESLGERQEALNYFKQALAARRGRVGEGAMLYNIGLFYQSLGEYQKALDYYDQALPLSRAVRNLLGEGAILNHIALVYESLGERQKALNSYNLALTISRAVGNRVGEGAILNRIGEVNHSLGENQRALDYYNQALELRRGRSGEGETLYNIAGIYASLGQNQKALDYYNQSLPLSRALGNRRMEAATLASIAMVEQEQGSLVEALAHAKAAIKLFELLGTEEPNEDLRAAYFSGVQSYYTLYIDLLMQLHQQQPGDEKEARALEASERRRARSLLETLGEAQADIRQGVDPTLLQRERSLKLSLKDAEKAQVEPPNGKHTEEQSAALRKQIEEILIQYEQIEAQIRVSSPRYAALTQPQPLRAQQIQQQLDGNTLLLEYSLGDSYSYFWAVDPDSLRSFQLPKRSEVEAAARRCYELLTARNRQLKGETEAQRQARVEQAETQYPQAARALSNMLLGPVASLLKGKRLVIVADGALQYMPFSALPEPGVESADPHRSTTTGDQASFVPLVVDHEIISLPSMSVLAVLRREIKERHVPARRKVVAVLADPVFDSQDPRVRRAARNEESGIQRQVQKGGGTRGLEETDSLSDSLTQDRLTRSASEVGSRQGGELHFARLAYSRREAQAILAAAPEGEGMVALDFKASLQTATDPELAQYRIVHFATHGLLNSAHPELSGLVLSLVDQQGRPQDGFLQLQDIYNLNLPADLVVLSACQTGLGKEIRGEGLMGMTRGFMYAGASRVIASLWKVDDVATAALMERLYHGMLTEGLQPAAALRQSQFEMWKQKRWDSPYYWAAFVIQGEWR